jgi:2-oxoisovalerate dehydrogenase E1 component
MVTIRHFEQRALELSLEGLIAGSVHLCLGQEAIPVGAMSVLGERDRVLTTYRGHGWAVACGVPLDALLGELCQKADGVNGGRGGSPYFFAPRWGMLGENSIVGAGVPIGAGVAMAVQRKGDGGVVLSSIGDGAMNQGAVHEGLLFAAARDLPLIVVCENNGWAEMTPSSAFARTEDLAERASAYGIEARIVDGNDPSAVADAVAEAAALAREGRGPVLLECKTHRLSGHYNRDLEHYREKADQEAARAADPIEALRGALAAAGEEGVEQVEAEAIAAVDAAVERVRAMADPDPATAMHHVYAEQPLAGELAADDVEGEELTYVKAVNVALRNALDEDPDVVVYG